MSCPGCRECKNCGTPVQTGSKNKKLDSMRLLATKMGYRFVGRHSAIKVCSWAKQSIRGKGQCYKQKFYGIDSSRCIQMTPAAFFCTFNCLPCWRNFDFIIPKKTENWDEPSSIVDGCVTAQRDILQGFFGNAATDKIKLMKAMEPRHVAISLSGEPALYPHLPQLVDEIMERKMTAFLVSNGSVPAMTKKLLDHQPTNMYITLYGTTPQMYKRTAVPMITDCWKKVMQSLSLLKKFDCSTVIRLTLAKGLNFTDAKGYAALVDKFSPKFLEVKAFMAVGGSRKFLKYEDMPLHNEIKDFAEQIERYSSYKIINEKTDSRVVLLSR